MRGPVVTVSASRKWVFRLAALVLVPLVLLAALELGLRVAGYGYPTSFFKPLRIGERDFLVENDKFGLRFFPPELARSPAPVKMEAHKPPGTCRIFLLGESAALGDPRPAYGAGRYLEVLLRERFPNAHFEVVCVAMTAINSHAILPIARECARHEGDIWIVYMGNNEMVGPFGATTVFGAAAPPLTFVRLNLALQKTRVGQLFIALGRKLKRGQAGASSWAGMEMFVKSQVAPGAPVREAVRHNFRNNLEDILRTGLSAGAHIILNTVAVNLKDCPPFASTSAAGRGPPSPRGADVEGGEPGTWPSPPQSIRVGSRTNLLGDRPGLSLLSTEMVAYEGAIHDDPDNAELHFRFAQRYLASTNPAAASKEFTLARDLDALPFRTTSRLNAIITQAANEFAGPNLTFCDAANFFSTNSPDGIPGHEWFYEHVHFNFSGNYRLALAWARQVALCLPTTLRNGGVPEWASQELCERRLGLTDWNRADVLDDMLRRMSQPPLSTQSNNAERMAQLRSELTALRRQMDRTAAKNADKLYLEALERAPEDFRLHENFAQFLEAVGDLPGALNHWQRVRELIPHHHLGWFETGRLLARQGKWGEAQAALSEAVSLRPDLSEGWLELGQVQYREGNQVLALADYERARRLLPQDHRVYYHIGKSLSKLDRRAEAIQQFRKAVQLRPTYWEGLYALGEELAFDRQVAEASTRFQQTLQLKPDYPPAHLNLGVALVVQGRLDEAVAQFQETLRLDPENKLAKEYLAQVQARLPK
ncbi:MAG TPA: tetratricopeptide repeat protein [Candidatus Acidoferrum sp.]|nr:tetratricopeptide repeat protein [Candidatus Acidoferrum sp.]